MDKLKQSALSFARLLQYEYKLVAGSKKTLLDITLFFQKSHFMHLIGLHKLTDLQLQRHSREKLYEMILNDELTYDYLKKSSFFSEIEDRIELFPKLESALDNNEIVVRYNQGFSAGTRIKSSYIIIFICEGMIIHYFIDCEAETGRFFGRSFFGRTDDKFLRGQQKFKVLKKQKNNIVTGEEIILFNKEK